MKELYPRLYKFFKSVQTYFRRDISLGARIYMSAFITIVAVGVALFYGLVGQSRLASITHEILDQRIEQMHTAEELKEAVITHNNAVLKFVVTKQPQELEESKRLAKEIRTTIQRLRLLTNNPVIGRRVEDLGKQANEYLVKIHSMIEVSKENKLPPKANLFEAAAWARSQDSHNQTLALISGAGDRQIDEILSACDELITLHRYQLSLAREEMDGILLESQRTALTVATAAGLIVFLVALLLAVSLIGSLKVLIDGVRRLENGDQDVELPINMPGEIGQLSQIFNRMSRRLQEQRQKLFQETITDELTGAFNQRHFRKLLKHEFECSKNQGTELSLVMIDTDHFKQYNDLQGHEMGNEVLKRVSQIIRDNLRDRDHLARYGGDEFAVLLPDTSSEEAREIAHRLVLSVSQADFPGQSANSTYPITLSVGGASFPTQAQSEHDLVVKADNALLEAKREGRNRFVWTSSDAIPV